MKRFWISAAAVVVVLAGGMYWWRDIFVRQAFAPTSQTAQPGVTLVEQTPSAVGENSLLSIKTVAEGLEIPWEVAWLPTGEMLVTERPGRLVKIGADKTTIEITGVAHVGEGGLQGMALHPEFVENHWVYLYLTTRSGESLINRLDRYRLEGNELKDKTTILAKIPGAQFHDGGRIAFSPDGFLYITTGDAGTPAAAQDTNSLAGKILRIYDDGAIPTDNPFGNAVYSYGHRNPQGLAWDEEGRLWSTEHGRSGVQSGFDELNLISKGGNYGWPESEGDTVKSGTIGPVLHSGAKSTWAPAGVSILGSRLYFVGLRGEGLYSVELSGEKVSGLTRHLGEQFGRLRALQYGPDGHLYVTTSNRDGRGTIRTGDDKVIRLAPEILLP